MSLAKDMYEAEQAQLKIDRAEMEKRNHAHMEALARQQPEPSIETIQAAAYKGRSADKPLATAPDVDVSAPLLGKGASKVEGSKVEGSKVEELKVEPVEKASEPEAASGGKYKTRDVTAKK